MFVKLDKISIRAKKKIDIRDFNVIFMFDFFFKKTLLFCYKKQLILFVKVMFLICYD